MRNPLAAGAVHVRGMNTLPGCPSGPELRVAFAMGAEVDITYDDETEVYSVKHAIWKKAGMRAWNGCSMYWLSRTTARATTTV